MNVQDTPTWQEQVRVMVAAEGASAQRLATVLSSDYVCVVAVADLGEDIAEVVRRLDVDVLVMAGANAMSTARAIAEEVATAASRVTVMIIDDPDAAADVRVFWAKDRIRRVSPRIEPPGPHLAVRPALPLR